MVEFLVQKGIKILFTIGGDGTQRGAMSIANEIQRRKLDIAIVGIPKTIDNDMRFMEKTFGFETAVEEAKRVVLSAHTEATSAYNGIAIVKLMGRDSGFIAAQASLASMDVNICLVPEVDFELDGKNGVFELIERRLNHKGHCVIAVAEGAGQKFFAGEEKRDKSGNLVHGDIGLFMKQQIATFFRDHPLRPTIKYIDPSYIIRSQPANANDSIFCLRLGQSAVHAAMAGKTNLVTGYWGRMFTHVPMKHVVSGRKNINPNSLFWQSVLEVTRQPRNMTTNL
jgi:6-phosphofructokinase 1